MHTFFICSLPRSRTAWLANFLSYGPCHCFHEPFNEYSIPDLPGLFRSTGRTHVGVSDSMSTLVIEKLIQVFPGAKVVVVRRPKQEVDESLVKLGLPCGEILWRMDRKLDQIQNQYHPFVIDFHNFDAAGVWNYLMPEVPLNAERLKMLEDFNVTVPKAAFMRKAGQLIEKYSLTKAN